MQKLEYEEDISPLLQFQCDPEKLKSHHKIKCDGVEILFPHKPYDLQVNYMKNVIKALNEGSNALLQSPTGTGKTLSLLCATLAWTQKQKKKIRIIYSSRVHVQLQQVAKELRETAYKPKISILGSRNQLCINENVNKQPDLNYLCNKLVKDKGCQYHNRNQLQSTATRMQDENLDIEDLKSCCRKINVCPYYLEIERKKEADIILTPYNYLLMKNLENYIEIEDSIIIFDEAHNIPQVAEEGQSFKLSQRTLIQGEQKLQDWIDKMKKLRRLSKDSKDYKDPSELTSIAANMNRLERDLKELNPKPLTQSFTISIIATIRILLFYFSENKQKNNYLLSQLVQISEQQEQHIGDYEVEQYHALCAELHKSINQFEPYPRKQLKDFLTFIHQLNEQSYKINQRGKYSYIVLIKQDEQITLQLKCLNPSIAFENFKNKNVYSIILTSGTLTPFDSWEQELDIQFGVTLDNGHLPGIQKNVKGFLLKQFNFSFKDRNDEQQLIDLGNIVHQLCDVIPGGILIVLSSYGVMKMIEDCWTKFSIIENLQKKKGIHWERKLQDKKELNVQNDKSNEQQKDTYWYTNNVNKLNYFKDMFDQYKKDANERGAILFCVQRGKYSEGIDLYDNLCRAVFLVGMPFLSIQDGYVIQKQQFIKQAYQTLTGKAWYRQQAIRSANQAIGRVIRHVNDYGAVFLCDSDDRFRVKELSSWVQPSITKIKQEWTENHRQEIKEFFDQMALKNKQNIKQEQIDIQATQQQNDIQKYPISNNIPNNIPTQIQQTQHGQLSQENQRMNKSQANNIQLNDQEIEQYENPQKKIKLKFKKG